jgi:TolA-binding protein
MNMSDEVKKNTLGTKVSAFIEKRKFIIILILCVILFYVVGYIVGSAIGSSSKNKSLSKIEEITYNLTNESMNLSDEEIETRRNEALSALEPFVKKSGISGARANMLCAEIVYQQKKYDDAANYWKNVASKSKKSYLAPIAYYNLGVCYEQLGNTQEASNNYKKAADNNDYILQTHAKFSYGRTLESLGKIDEAKVVYQDLNDKNPDDTWAKIAKTRLLVLDNK